MLNVAMLSDWHVHAKGYAKELASMSEVKITCVFSENAESGAAWAKELGADFEPCLDTLLKRADVDAVCVDTPTNMHPEVMIKAANAGKHIFTEKVLALTVAECDEIIDAIEKNGVKFCISFPHRGMARNILVKKLIEDGVLGEISVIRVRNAHDGAQGNWLPEKWYDPITTGGGAMMDLGAHPMYLIDWMMGRPANIQSAFTYKFGREIEDNSVCVMEYAGGGIAISETSFITPMSPYMLEVYGTEGVVIVCENDIKLMTKCTRNLVDGGWIKPKMPDAERNPLRIWVDGIVYGKDIPYDLKAARALTELMEKAYVSHKTGTKVAF